MLRGDKTLDDNDVFTQWNGTSDEISERDLGDGTINRMITLPWRPVVPSRWKLNLWAGDHCELFDMNTDPHELNYLYNEPA